MDPMILAPAMLYLVKAGEKVVEEVGRDAPEYEGLPGRRKSTAVPLLLMLVAMCRGNPPSIRTTYLTKNSPGGK